MELTIERGSLLKALSHVHSVVERRNTIPILANILIEAKGGVLSLTATDMDLEIDEKIPADVTQAGATTAPAHTLFEIVRKLPEGAELKLSTSGEGQLAIRAGRSRFTLACLPSEEFPVMQGQAVAHRFELPAAELRGLIDRTRFAISTEETRFYLNGIYLHAAQGLRAVATDGHRLARVEVPLPAGAEGMPGVIIPRKTVGELRKLIETTVEPIRIELSEAKIRLAFDQVIVTSKLIDGTFPDYERVIPTGNDKFMTVGCAQFREAVDRVSTISTERNRAIKISLARDQLTLSATSPETGTASEDLTVGYPHAPIEIGFNARYLLEITQQIETDEARFAFADAAAPTLVEGSNGDGALYVLMPMRV